VTTRAASEARNTTGLERPGQTLGQAALRFMLANPAVHCVVPGARTREQLESNVPAADADLTPTNWTGSKHCTPSGELTGNDVASRAGSM
jgi:aryl-alcohol dehydrogenase-like predicted oxidoreductase